ncbi:MAG TPA: NusA-like transcription termination signal-binding factor [Candidatus Bathyarchaeia archaeon]|nr:MAG: transcription elongation factor NusA [Candidatus Bathyarchaeota archaeon RBG_16_48_13]HJX24467.1 NusA-like transcription termination signal-binding factor [Candidatus Bathyarchaeia archaeon]
MPSKILLREDEIKYMALFENVTGALAKDCIIDEKANRIIYVVKAGNVGLAIGKGGYNVKLLMRMINKNVEIVEFDEQPTDFIKNALAPARINEVRITVRPDGRKIAVIAVEPKDKGVAIGKDGRTVERIRFLAKRYFEISDVVIS